MIVEKTGLVENGRGMFNFVIINKIKEYFGIVNFVNRDSGSLSLRFIKGSILNFIATVFNQGSSFIASILVARILTRQSFGEYAMLLSTMLTISSISQLSMGYTATKYVAEFRSVNPMRAGRIIGLCSFVIIIIAFVSAIVFLLSSSWLTTIMLKAPNLKYPLILGLGFVFFSAVNGYQIGTLVGLEAYSSLANVSAFSGIIGTCGIAVGAWLWGLNGIFFALSITGLLRWLFYNIYLSKELRLQKIVVSYKGLSKERDIIFKFAIPAAIAGYCSMPALWIANSFLVRQPGGYLEMALYEAAFNIKSMLLFVPVVMNTVMLSLLNHVKGSNNLKRYSVYIDLT